MLLALSFTYSSSSHRGLALSDFWMAMNFLSSAAVNLTPGHNIGSENEKAFCSFNGFMIQVFVVQSKCPLESSIAKPLSLVPRPCIVTRLLPGVHELTLL
jgi:hypothetical protein